MFDIFVTLKISVYSSRTVNVILIPDNVKFVFFILRTRGLKQNRTLFWDLTKMSCCDGLSSNKITKQ